MAEPPEERPAPPPGPPTPGSAEEALRRLEQRLDRATEAAERLMAEAAAEAARAASPEPPASGPEPPASGTGPRTANPSEPVQPPPAGWQIPEDSRDGDAPGLDPLVTLLQAVRELIPADLQRRLVAALRELLLALRALIDWYLERLERRREQSVQLEDIPIL